jgi:hypothetical protein
MFEIFGSDGVMLPKLITLQEKDEEEKLERGRERTEGKCNRVKKKKITRDRD